MSYSPPDITDAEVIPVEGTAAGRAFKTSNPVQVPHGEQIRLWMPAVAAPNGSGAGTPAIAV